MNIEAYKSSGILEEYLLGLLSESEAREVERVVAAYPEIKAELNAMEDALTQYAVAKGVSMPRDLPDRIIRRLETLDKNDTPPDSAQSNPARGWRTMLPVLGVLFIAALGTAIYFWFQRDRLGLDLQQTENDLQQLQVQCDEVQSNLDQAEVQLAILRSEGNQTYIMRGNENNPGAIANIYYNPQDQRAFLDIRELPAPPAGQQYQLWGIGTGGVRSMNVFDIPQGEGITFLEVPYIPEVSTFAVSLEPAGGSPTPTSVHLISG